jgi:uncharacterized protein
MQLTRREQNKPCRALERTGRMKSKGVPVKGIEMAENKQDSDRGFASMDKDRQCEIASEGGKTSGANFAKDQQRAQESGHKGGSAEAARASRALISTRTLAESRWLKNGTGSKDSRVAAGMAPTAGAAAPGSRAEQPDASVAPRNLAKDRERLRKPEA